MKPRDSFPASSIVSSPRSGGFTLVELLVTVSVAAILLAVAVPNFRDFLLNSRRGAQVNELVLALAYAKSEATKRNLPVIVCSTANGTSCANSTTWSNGWLVFVDIDSNSAWTNGTDVILQVRAPLEGGNTLCYGHNQVLFQSTGFTPISNGTFNLYDSRGTTEGRRIIVSRLGRVTTSQTGVTACP